MWWFTRLGSSGGGAPGVLAVRPALTSVPRGEHNPVSVVAGHRLVAVLREPSSPTESTTGDSTNESRLDMNCPTDGTRLEMSERSGIEIDYCPTCRGVWLDRGELDKIIERNELSVRPRDDDPQRREPQSQKKKKKKMSFLSELFEGGGD